MKKNLSLINYPPALMSQKTAAAYCDMSVDFFLAHCPVKPIYFTQSTKGSRYLRVRIDEWIEALDPNEPTKPAYTLEELVGEKAGRKRL